MTNRAQELLEKALGLSEEERAELAGSLLESLEATSEADVEAAWQEEIARRVSELDSGKVRAISWKEAQKQFASRLSHGTKKG